MEYKTKLPDADSHPLLAQSSGSASVHVPSGDPTSIKTAAAFRGAVQIVKWGYIVVEVSGYGLEGAQSA